MSFALLLDLLSLLRTCAPEVAPETMAAIVSVESGGNPFAIGVVGARLTKQPASLKEAIAVAKKLEELGKNFSVGLGQINVENFAALGLSYEQAFDPCENLRAASAILTSCYQRAKKIAPSGEKALTDALSCYYSGNFTRGYEPESDGQSYVAKVLAAVRPLSSPVVPALGGAPLPSPPLSLPGAAAALPVAKAPKPLPPPLLLPASRCQGAVLDVCVKAPPAAVPLSGERKEAAQGQSALVF